VRFGVNNILFNFIKNVMLYLIIIIVLVWIAVLYLSFDKKIDNKQKKIDYKNTAFYGKLENIDIKNNDILKLKQEISKYIIGSENLINSIIVSLLSNWHILVEWLPGLAKTKTILVISKLLWLNFQRIQFTPDMLPADIIWWEIYNKNIWKFDVMMWSIFTNILLADEINRATPKVQSALLQAMAEKKVTLWKKTFDLENPFFVLATQNPIEQEGTYPLPEAQLDRFLMKVEVEYPTFEEERKILDNFDKNIDNIEQVILKDNLLKIQEEIKSIFLPDNVKDYIIKLVESTRNKDENILVWASTRWIIALKQASSTLAYLKWNIEVSIEDVKQVALLTLNHRIKSSSLGIMSGKDINDILIEKFINIKDF